MQTDRNKILVESIKRLLRRGATTHLGNIVNKTHAADLSVVFRSLSLMQQRKLFDMITDIEQKGILFSELDEDTFYWFELIGIDVYTKEEQHLGQIESIIQTGSNDVYVVKNGDKEILIPAIESVVLDVNLKQKRMQVDVPDGLE